MEAESVDIILVTEVSLVVGAAGLVLVFVPFFLDNLAASRERLPHVIVNRLTVVAWAVGLSLLIPAAGATVGLVTLWGGPDFTRLTHVLTLATVWLVMALAILAVWLRTKGGL